MSTPRAPVNWEWTKNHFDEFERALVQACAGTHDWNDPEPPKLVAGCFYVYRGEVTLADVSDGPGGYERPSWNPNYIAGRTRRFGKPPGSATAREHGGFEVTPEHWPYTGYHLVTRGWRLDNPEYPTLLQPPLEKCRDCPIVLECRNVLKGVSA